MQGLEKIRQMNQKAVEKHLAEKNKKALKTFPPDPTNEISVFCPCCNNLLFIDWSGEITVESG